MDSSLKLLQKSRFRYVWQGKFNVPWIFIMLSGDGCTHPKMVDICFVQALLFMILPRHDRTLFSAGPMWLHPGEDRSVGFLSRFWNRMITAECYKYKMNMMKGCLLFLGTVSYFSENGFRNLFMNLSGWIGSNAWQCCLFYSSAGVCRQI